MATVEQCEEAVHRLAGMLSDVGPHARPRGALNRTVSCRIPDLEVIFAGHLLDGEIRDIRRVDVLDGQIKLTVASDDLVALTDGELKFGAAWTSGKLKVDASIFDLLKLRNLL